MNENLTEKEQNNTFIKQTSFISSIDPNITTNHTFRIIKKRMPWSEEEDKSIKTLVSKYGTGNWTLISNEMGQNRSGKQCRERWYNQLKPNVKKNNWTDEEENILFTKHMQFGNKWSDIASFLPGRTLNDIKNHFYSNNLRLPLEPSQNIQIKQFHLFQSYLSFSGNLYRVSLLYHI